MDKEKISALAQQNGINVSIYTEDMYIETQNNTKDVYSIDDCILIRTTNIFPTDKIVETPANGNAYSFTTNDLFIDAIENKISREQSNVNKDDYDIYYDICRTTTHFTINGLVSSHMYGNFDDRSYIIMDPLKHHIDEESLVGLRVEDTYFNNDIALSDEAIILIPSQHFEKICGDPNYQQTLRQFNVVLFDGDEVHAVNYVLNQLGYNAFLTNQHGYVSGEEENKMVNFVYRLTEEKNISNEKHYYSQVRTKDAQNMINSMSESELRFLNFVLDSVMLPENLKNEIIYCRDNRHNIVLKELIESLVDIIGLEQLKYLTQQYNQERILENQAKKPNKKI